MKDKTIVAEFPNEQLFAISGRSWFADITNFKAGNLIPNNLSQQHKKNFLKINVWLCNEMNQIV